MAESTDRTSPNGTTGRRKRFVLKDETIEVKEIMEGNLSVEEKLDSIHKKYNSLVRDYKRIERRIAESQKKLSEVAGHRDIIQNEVTRITVAKTKLEGLCRELQKQNKQVLEDSRVQAREEEEKRLEVAEKFQVTIDDITVKMQEQHTRNTELKLENTELLNKLKKLIDQYEARETQFEELLKHKQLELQLCEAKLAQQMVAIAETKESNMAERQYLLAETLDKQKRCEELTRQEIELRGQISLYSEKFDDFQKTLTKSNEVFSTFKQEMDKMAKKIMKLEKESNSWKVKYEKCSRSLLEMAQERVKHEESIKTLHTKNQKLEQLCRALQNERNQATKKSPSSPDGEHSSAAEANHHIPSNQLRPPSSSSEDEGDTPTDKEEKTTTISSDEQDDDGGSKETALLDNVVILDETETN